MANERAEIPVEMDANTAQIRAAFDYIMREIARVQVQVGQIGVKAQAGLKGAGLELTTTLKQLSQLQREMRTINNIGSDAMRKQVDEARGFFRMQETERKASIARQTAAELEGARIVANANRAQMQSDIEATKMRAAARLDATRADIRSNALAITSEKQLLAARADNVEKLRQYRAAQKTETDPQQLRALQQLIALERDRGRALDQNARKMEVNASRMSAQGFKSDRLLVPGNVSDLANTMGARSALVAMQTEQELARRQLLVAVSKEDIAAAQRRLELANLQVNAASRLVAQQEREVALEQRLASANRTETIRTQTALSQQYAREQIAALGGAEALKRAKEQTLIAEQRLLDAERAGTREMQQQAREQLRVAQSRQNAVEGQSGLGGPPKRSLGARAGTALLNTALYGGAATAIFGTISAIQQGVQFTLEFEDALAKLQGISGATDGQMQQLKASIIEVGQSSRYSINEITEASTSLAQAGFSVQAIGESLKAASDLAAASGSSLSTSTDLITSAIGSFQMQEGESARVADVLVNALNRTKLTTDQVAAGIQYAGATAYEQNLTFEDLTATMGAMAQAGIRSGSTIGTGLRQFLVDLQTPSQALSDQLRKLGLTFDDINVKTLGLPAVLENLRNAGFGSAEAYGSLETRAAAAFLVLSNNIDTINQLTIAQNQMGAAATAAAKAQDSVSAQWQQYKNNLGSDWDSGTSGISNWVKELLKAENRSYAFTAAMDKMSVSSDGTVRYFDQLADGVKNLAQQYADGKISEEEYYQIRQYYGEENRKAEEAENMNAEAVDRASTAYANATDKVNEQYGVLSSLQEAIDRVNSRQGSLTDGSVALQAETSTLTSRFAGLIQYLDGAALSYDNLTMALRRYQQQQLMELSTRLLTQEAAARAQGDSQLNAARGTASLIGGIREEDARGGRSFGLFGRSRANPRFNSDFYKWYDMARTTGDANQRSFALGQISDMLRRGAITDPYAKRIANSFVEQLGGAVNSRRQETNISTARGTIDFAASPAGTALRNRVSDLGKTGVSQDTVKSTISELQGQFDRSRNPAERAYLGDLIQQAQSHLGGQSSLKPPKKTRTPRGSGAAGRAARREAFVDNTGTKTAELDLRDALKDAKDPLTLDAYNKGRERVEAAFKAYSAARFEAMESEIKAKGLSGTQAEEYRRQIREQVETKGEEVQRTLNQSFKSFIDGQLEVAQSALERALRPGELAVNVAQGVQTGFGLYSNQNRVPDYIQTLQQQKILRLQEDQLRASVAPKQAYKANLDTLIANSEAEIARLTAANTDGSNDNIIAQRTKELQELKDKAQQTNDELVVLQATLNAGSEVPTTLDEAVRKAIDAYRQTHQLSMNLKDTLIQNVGGALSQVHDGLTTMFTDIFSGSKSALAAFGDFVIGMGKYLAQLAAQFVANQIFNQILSLFGTAVGGKVAAPAGGGAPTTQGFVGPPAFNGGAPANDIPGYIGGGRVTNGSPLKDSVLSNIARDEWVVRKKAVDSVGHQFMADLNAHGAAAVAAANKTAPIVMPQQQVGVYVVAPNKQPQLGKNDILVTVQEDMLSGGETAKLVKMINNG